MSADRYSLMSHRRCGRSGLVLPAVSLGAWQGIGSYIDESAAKVLFTAAFDLGIHHFDFANNYGDPAGASEALAGRILADLPRHELVLSSKAGYRMWPGPHGDGGSRKYLIQSCEQSLRRLRVDHVDIFYSHRPDPQTPIHETMGALKTLVDQGKALYAGLSNYHDAELTAALAAARDIGLTLTIHQPRYNLLDRRPETSVLPQAAAAGLGVIAFSPLAQGLLTARYLSGIPADSRAASTHGNGALGTVNAAALSRARRLNDLASLRSQTLAQMALSWVLRDPRVTAVLIGASRIEQLRENVRCLDRADFTPDELSAIDDACL
jgi:L-glyceraldehyde 3-phosphate reductase